MAILTRDKYSVNARLMPALITLLPLGLAIINLFPPKFAGWDLLTWLLTTTGLTVLLEQMVRDIGKKRQPELINIWGGMPTVKFLQHKESLIGPISLNRYHKNLETLIGITLPTGEDEANNPSGADEKYQSCVEWLIANTRGNPKFDLILEENINYGFRRNLWAMKPIAIFILLFSISITCVQLYRSFALTGFSPIGIIGFGLDYLLLLTWIFVINPGWVKKSAETYAQQLLTACDQLKLEGKSDEKAPTTEKNL